MALTSRLKVGDSVEFWAVNPDMKHRKITFTVDSLGGSIRNRTATLAVEGVPGLESVDVSRNGDLGEVVDGIRMCVGNQPPTASAVNLRYDYSRGEYHSRTVKKGQHSY